MDKTIDQLWDEAFEEQSKGNAAGVLSRYLSIAEMGDSRVYVKIGSRYAVGTSGVNIDMEEALKWYGRAVSECDDPIAHFFLGQAYYTGNGVEQDFSKAYPHFEKAYLAQVPEAGICIGDMYYYGNGMKRNLPLAREYFEFAAAHEYFFAYRYLWKIEFANHRYARGIGFMLRGLWLGLKVGRSNPNDVRLFGIKKKNRRVNGSRAINGVSVD